jgi:hypothetical protein
MAEVVRELEAARTQLVAASFTNFTIFTAQVVRELEAARKQLVAAMIDFTYTEIPTPLGRVQAEEGWGQVRGGGGGGSGTSLRGCAVEVEVSGASSRGRDVEVEMQEVSSSREMQELASSRGRVVEVEEMQEVSAAVEAERRRTACVSVFVLLY